METIIDNEVCLVTESSDADFSKTRILILTFLNHNNWFTGNIYILLTNDGIKESFKNELSSIYPNINFIDTRVQKTDLLRPLAFKIKSKCTIYASPNCLINGDISDVLESTTISSVNLTQFDIKLGVDLLSDIDSNFMVIPHNVDSDELYKLVSKARSKDINKRINTSINKLGITPAYDILITRSLFYPNDKYSNFVRWNKNIKIIIYHFQASAQYSRINMYWVGVNKRMSKIKPTNLLNVSNKQEIMDSGTSLSDIKEISNKRISLCTICNDKFIPGLRVMLTSFLRNNNWFNGDIIILYEKQHSDVSEENQNLIKSEYRNVIFREVDVSDYSELISQYILKSKRNKNAIRLVPSLYTFEIFEIAEEYDTLLYLDSDMVILGGLSELFKMKEEIIVTPDAGSWDLDKNYSTFNGGFMVINSTKRTRQYKYDLIQHGTKMRHSVLADQTIMNSYFNIRKLTFLNSRYNCLKRCFNDSNYNNFDSGIKVVHYVGAKPWDTNKKGIERNYTKIEKMWHLVHRSLTSNKVNLTPKKHRVLVIGNSTTILDHDLGKTIDNFDVVIRINDFKIEGFEDKIGTKVNYWSTSFSPAIDIRDVSNFDGIITSNVSQKHSVFMDRILRIVPKTDLNKVNIISDRDLSKLKKEIGYSDAKKWPTTGMLSIWSALNTFKDSEIYIHGFNFFKDSGKYVSHYWNETKKEGYTQHHDHILEEKYVNKLLKRRKIRKLM